MASKRWNPGWKTIHYRSCPLYRICRWFLHRLLRVNLVRFKLDLQLFVRFHSHSCLGNKHLLHNCLLCFIQSLQSFWPGGDCYFFEVFSTITIANENWRVASIWHNDLNGADIIPHLLPFKTNNLDRFVFWHSLEILNTWVPETNFLFCAAEKWELSDCF